MKLKFYYEDGGRHSVLGQTYDSFQEIICENEDRERYQHYIANTLTFAVPTIEECDQALAAIEKVDAGIEAEIEIEGNTTDYILNASGVQVDINVNDDWVDNPEGKFTLSEMKNAIIGWKEFLGMPESLESKVEVEL